MKKILLIAVLIGAMFSVSAYVVCVAAPLFGKSIKGSGNIVTRTLPAPDFNAVDASRAVKVVISAEASDIRIEADDNLIDLVVAETKGKTLIVTLDQKVNNIQNADITVTIPANGGNIRSLKASSASKITSDVTLRADKFLFDASSAAKIKAAVETASCSIDASSASKISAEVQAAACTVDASSASKIALTGRKFHGRPQFGIETRRREVHCRQRRRQHVERLQGQHRLQRKTHGQRIERVVDRLHGRLPDLAEQIQRRQRTQKLISEAPDNHERG
jgi:hypothetical protein